MENNISFTKTIKEELTTLKLSAEGRVSLLSAFVRNNGSLVFSNNKEILVIKTENASIAKYIYQSLKEVYKDLAITISYRKSMNLYKNTQFLLNVNDRVNEVLKDFSINFLEDKIPYILTSKDERISCYLAGCFLASGSCNSPVSSNYHLEISSKDMVYSNNLLKVIEKIKSFSFHFKIIKRKTNYVVYLKRSDEIASFLAFINANNSCLDFENIRVDRDFSNITNRMINCDTYNYNKSIKKANEQFELIKLIDSRLGINNIEDVRLKELCRLRTNNLEASYQELATLLSEKLNKKINKALISRLFIKLETLGEIYK